VASPPVHPRGPDQPEHDHPLIVNGVNAATVAPTLTVSENRIRFHLLNGSINDIVTSARSDGGTLTLVATDAALLPAPTAVTSVRLVAGERAEVVRRPAPSRCRTWGPSSRSTASPEPP
jgi:FtsP/CotA-like multicopper oxidase with cupredoxin domain